MEVFCGAIAKLDGAIDTTAWASIIASNPLLEQFPDRHLKNPFTQAPIFAPGDGCAYFLQNGVRIGNMALVEGIITTTGVPRIFCEEIALKLQATFSVEDYS